MVVKDIANGWRLKDGLWTAPGQTPRSAGDLGTILLANTGDALPTGPLTAANLRTYWGDPTMGVDSTKLPRCSIENTEKGKAFVWTGEGHGDQSPITFYPKLANQTFDKIKLSCWMRFDTGFDPGLGGKICFGVGSYTDGTTNPPSGSTTPDPLGCSSRPMWLYDSVGGVITNRTEMIGYHYLPAATQINRHGDQNGGPIDLGSASVLEDGWHYHEWYHEMNSTGTNGSATQPTDGIWRWTRDGLIRSEITNIVWRRYSDNHWTKLMIDSFWGGSVDWSPAGGPYKYQLAQVKVVGYT